MRIAGKFLFLVGWAGMLSNASWFASLAMANVEAGRPYTALSSDEAWFLKFFLVLWLVPICVGMIADGYARLRQPALVPVRAQRAPRRSR